MNEYSSDEIRIYAPAEKEESVSDGYPQFTIANTGWTEEEKNAMRERGYASMDMLRAWLS